MNSNCSICHEPFKPAIAMVTTLCGHIFHFSCISNWLEHCGVNGSCPECRRKVDKQSLITLFFNWDDNNVEDELRKQLHEMYLEIKELQTSNDLLKRSLNELNKDVENSHKDMESLRLLNRFALSDKEDCERKIETLLDCQRKYCEDIQNFQIICTHLEEKNKILHQNEEAFIEEILIIKRENEKLGRIKAEYEELWQLFDKLEFTGEYINYLKKIVFSNVDDVNLALNGCSEEEKLNKIALYCSEIKRGNSVLMEQKAHLQNISALSR
ncbi:E3 ubiquitin-protein ligase TRAIP-like [Argiope bruennichi]|uniref:E3 ubiquitin-protein ligase TRAIP-like n=1 Tax=Argiope bruennichi TaxID=94029 RepID=UPI002494E70F|nr:E3 ubiquitin-protein ligase TRAIP-like [Argiope bruennichi]